MHRIRYEGLSCSITVEASLSFSLVLFILFLTLGPIFILKSSEEIILTVDNQSKMISYYEMLKENLDNDNTDYKRLANDELNDEIYVNDMEVADEDIFSNVIFESLVNLVNYELLLTNIKHNLNENQNEYNVYDNISFLLPYDIDVYDEKTKIIKYDFFTWFKLPYNLFNIDDINQRFVSYRRAFVGVDGDRFADNVEAEDDENKAYIARNHINSHIYHVDRYCTYLEKRTTSIIFENLNQHTNDNGDHYTACEYCLRNIHLSDNSIIYITKYGDRYHHLAKCPKMTAIVTEITIDEAKERGLSACSRCSRDNND